MTRVEWDKLSPAAQLNRRLRAQGRCTGCGVDLDSVWSSCLRCRRWRENKRNDRRR